MTLPAHGFWAVAIGVSTGGPESLDKVVPLLPATFPLPVLLVQHMPPKFTAALAERLDRLSALNVVEAEDGQAVVAGTVYVAPGGIHMIVRPTPTGPIIGLSSSPPVHSCRPAVDVLMHSLAVYPERRGVLAVVMTGMGRDGTDGVRLLKGRGCHCITQTEATCVVYGMPREVDVAGLSDESVPLDRIAERIVARVNFARLATGQLR